MSNSRTPEKEENDHNSEIKADTIDNIWMLRPCQLYLDEYNECSSFRGKFQEKYVYGQTRTGRCQQWLADYENCIRFRKTRNLSYAEAIIESEGARRHERLDNAKANDVWQYRSKPPADWNAPLPEHLEKSKLPDLTKLYENPNRCIIS